MDDSKRYSGCPEKALKELLPRQTEHFEEGHGEYYLRVQDEIYEDRHEPILIKCDCVCSLNCYGEPYHK